MKTICPQCFQEYDIADSMLNKEVSCGVCQQQFTAKTVKICPACNTVNPFSRTVCRRCSSKLPVPRGANSPAAYEQSTRDKKFPFKQVVWAVIAFLVVTSIIYFWRAGIKRKQEKESITCTKALSNWQSQACPVANKPLVILDLKMRVPYELQSKFPEKFCPVRHRSSSSLIPVKFADGEIKEVLVPDELENPGDIAEYIINQYLDEESETKLQALKNAEKYK